jgi:hypothetical protein
MRLPTPDRRSESRRSIEPEALPTLSIGLIVHDSRPEFFKVPVIVPHCDDFRFAGKSPRHWTSVAVADWLPGLRALTFHVNRVGCVHSKAHRPRDLRFGYGAGKGGECP